MKIFLSHPTGNANVRAILNGLIDIGYLGAFHTSIACFKNNFWDNLSNIRYFSEIKRRRFNQLAKDVTHMYPYKDIGRMLATKLKIERLIEHESGYFSIDSVYRYTDKKAAQSLRRTSPISLLYAYEDGALESFRQAKLLGIKCVYDLPIAYWETSRKFLYDEANRLPLWACTLAGGIKDTISKLDRKTEELYLADYVVVASKFVENSLPESAKSKKIIFSPFGSPSLQLDINKSINIDKPLRVLFVGSMGQRKGLGDLFNAFRMLNTKKIELVVMGSLLAPIEFYKQQFNDFIYEPPRAHRKVLELMRSCDVFCLPSIIEGRALVMQEAMSQELPLVITPNTGGEDLIVEGKTGFLIPIRSPEKIAEKLEWFLVNRRMIKEMGINAKLHSETYTWKKYAKTIIERISE